MRNGTTSGMPISFFSYYIVMYSLGFHFTSKAMTGQNMGRKLLLSKKKNAGYTICILCWFSGKTLQNIVGCSMMIHNM